MGCIALRLGDLGSVLGAWGKGHYPNCCGAVVGGIGSKWCLGRTTSGCWNRVLRAGIAVDLDCVCRNGFGGLYWQR